ncbi:aromatic prenyltransferase [Microthyrium microscopicum]|uniref:Aromatic prenyltransferase n=1 Tax=Microthyrium microscopicum TaxID=703497 RepID=A0A6A6UNP3_9PEZI|nr:aromatic prenyltransferase [Microthyrium microscopicum]
MSNGHPIVPVSKPWETLGSILGFNNADEEFWWKCTAPVLGKFLVKAEYTTEQQFTYLSWYHRFILPSLGERPEQGKPRKWRAQVTPGASPFQPSWNLQGNKSTVRFTVEPIGRNVGSREDVFNQLAAIDLMRKLKTTMPDIQDDWFYHCVKQLYVPKDVINMMLLAQGPPQGPKPPTCFVAFDLLKDKIESKAYFFPHMQARLLAVNQGDLVIQTVRGLNGDGIDMNPSLDAFEEYLNSGGPLTHGQIEMLAIDNVDKKRARAKIYVNSFNNTFNKIKDIYTMGGRIKDAAILKSLDALADVWKLLFNLPETGFEDMELPNIMHPRSGFVTGFEFKTGEALPTTKIYFPMWHYAKTDQQLTDALSAFFSKQGWNDRAKSYSNDVSEIFMESEMPYSPGTHQYLSFSAKAKSGLYLTMYYSPTIPHLSTRHVPSPEGEGHPMELLGPPKGPLPVGFRVMQTIWPALRMVVPGQVGSVLDTLE